jgi:hypothetical protein
MGKMIKKITIILVLILSACSAPWHLQKAIKKQPDIIQVIPDTVTTFVNFRDTIWTERGYIVRDTLIEVKTVTNTIYIQPKSRFDYKSERDSLRHVLKMEKEFTKQARIQSKEDVKKARFEAREAIKKTKQEEYTKRAKIRRENRSNWWKWLLVGLVVGLLIRFIWNRKPFVLPL